MLLSEKCEEFRRHPRFKVRSDVFVGIGPNSIKIGQLLNVSRGGMAFKSNDQKTRFFQAAELSIIVDDNELNINVVPFKFKAKMVSVTDISNRNPFNFTKMRRFSVVFEALSDYQIFWLDYFIRNHTLCQVPGDISAPIIRI
jgi:hypothetical protein